jgi:hypothetical protein
MDRSLLYFEVMHMPPRYQILCVNKSDRENPYEKILFIGGVREDGSGWKISQSEAIEMIEKEGWEFYVSRGERVVDVIVATSPHGNKYLRTIADDVHLNNLLNLPECS